METEGATQEHPGPAQMPRLPFFPERSLESQCLGGRFACSKHKRKYKEEIIEEREQIQQSIRLHTKDGERGSEGQRFNTAARACDFGSCYLCLPKF